MTAFATSVQLPRSGLRERLLLAVTDPRDLGEEEVLRLLLDLPKSDLALIEQYALFKNAVAAVQDKKLKRQWSRKSLAEQFLSDQCDVLRKQLEPMWTEVGPFPELTDDAKKNRALMEKYAARVVDLADSKKK